MMVGAFPVTTFLTPLEHGANVLIWVALAALVEACFYFSMASERWRARWQPLTLVALAPASYLAYTVPLGVFDVRQLAAILAAVALSAWWFRFCGKSRWAEAGFLLLAAAVILSKFMPQIYPRADEMRMDFLGQLVWIRVTLITLLRETQPEGVGFGFWPSCREWKIGAAAWAALLPVAGLLAWATGFARFTWPEWAWWETLARAVGTFFGILWVVALSEEFFFRGILQRRIGILAASVLFGLVHLGFRQFPNWGMVAFAAIAGVFYGLAYERARSIRASMVAHALTVVTWKMLFR
jgi:membrane protease YdiL (CAAX protease family)